MDYEIECKLDLYKVNFIVKYEDSIICKCDVSYDYNYFINTKLRVLRVYDEKNTSICEIKEKRNLIPYKRYYGMNFNDDKKIQLKFKIKKDATVESTDLPVFNNFKWREHNLNYTLLVPHAENYTIAAECKYKNLSQISFYIHGEYISYSTQILSMLFVMITENLDKPNIIANIGI